MNETINDGQVMSVSKLLEGANLKERDEAGLWRWMVDEVDLQLHSIVSVLWAAEQLPDNANDLTLNVKEKECRVRLLVTVAKEMAENLNDEITRAYSEIQQMQFPNKQSEHRQDRAEA